MLFARGHLNLYLSSRISLPSAPFVHLSSPFPSSSSFLSPLSLSLVSRSTVAEHREAPGKITGNFEERGGGRSQEALAAVSRVDSPYSIFEGNFLPVRGVYIAYGVISLKYLQIFQRLGTSFKA